MNKQKLRRIAAWIFIACMLVPTLSLAGEWHSDGTNWYYQNSEGTNQIGWINDAGNWYHLKLDGRMNTGWYQDERQDWYYLNTKTEGIEGSMRTGWFWKDGVWYFLNTVHDGFYGRTITGRWQWIDGYCYLFNDKGMMYADCITPDGYTVNSDGQWTVNGVAQYIPGKGILTKQQNSNTSSSRSRNSGGNGSTGSTGNQQQIKSKLIVQYKELDSNHVLGTVTYEGIAGNTITLEQRQFNGYTICTGQPQEALFEPGEHTITIYYWKNSMTGKIIVQCVIKETGELLAQREVIGELGENFVAQQPVFLGYKLLEKPTQVLTFKKEIQTVAVYYRVQQPNEEPDQRIILADNFKAISPRTSEQFEIVNQMREQIFDYNVDEYGNAELAVMNDNPLLQYIYDGKYQENDIIYIDLCDAFPTGFIMTYHQHDDNYSGEYDDYNANECEVIRGKKTEFFELFKEGTYIDYHLEAKNNEIQLEKIFEWSINDGEEDNPSVVYHALNNKSSERSKSHILSLSFSTQITENAENTSNGTNNGNSQTGTNTGNNQTGTNAGNNQTSSNTGNNQNSPTEFTNSLGLSINGSATLDSFSFSMDHSLDGFKGIDFSADLSESIDVEMAVKCNGNISDFLIKQLTSNRLKKRENALKAKLFGIEMNLSGVDVSKSYIIGAVGFTYTNGSFIPPSLITADNLFATPTDTDVAQSIGGFDDLRHLHWQPTFFIPAILDLEAIGEIDGHIGGHFEFQQHIGTNPDENIQQEPESQNFVQGQFAVKGNLYAGPATGLGFSVLNITPAMGKVTIAFDANADGQLNFNLWPEFNVMPTGKITADLSLQAIIMLKLTGTIAKDFTIFGKDFNDTTDINLSWEWQPWHYTFLNLEFPKDPKTLTVTQNMSVTAANAAGFNISNSFSGYDPQSKTLKTKPSTKGYTFQCPAYVKEEDKTYAVTSLEAKENQCIDLDLSKAEHLEEISLDSVSIKQLDVSANKKLKTVNIINCRNLETFTGNGTAFPTQLTWYKDKEKTQQVTTAQDFAAGETIYSENYGLTEVEITEDHTLYLVEDTAVTAVDKFGRDISSSFEGYKDGKVTAVKHGDTFSFQCPQYIKTETGDYFRITFVSFNTNGAQCETLDLSKAPEVQRIRLVCNKFHTLITAPDNEIEHLEIKYIHPSLSIDFSQLPSLTILSLSEGIWKNELDLSQNNNLETLTLRNMELSGLQLPEKSSLKQFTLENCDKIDQLDLSKQKQLTKLGVLSCPGIKLLDVSGCTELTQWSDRDVSKIMYTMFKGNGKIFPLGAFGTWFSDENKTEKVNSHSYDGYSLLYSKNYEKPTSRQASKATTNKELSSPSNAAKEPLSSPSNAKRVQENID